MSLAYSNSAPFNIRFPPHQIVVYFVPHLRTFPDPILSPVFHSNLEKCNTFVLEYAEQWMDREADLELRYNKLSRGEISRVREGMLARANLVLDQFTDNLQGTLCGKNKRIVLEKPPCGYVDTAESDVIEFVKSIQLQEAISLYKSRQADLAHCMVQRDDALVDLLRAEMRNGKRLFVLRGAAHERYLMSVFEGRSITAKCLRFEDPPLSVCLTSCLTMNEPINDVDVLRVIYALVNLRNADYAAFRSLQKEAESMTEEQLRNRLS